MVLVALGRGGAADDEVLVGGEAGEGDVGLVGAACVEHARCRRSGPTGTATSAVHSHCSAASASGPVSRYLENEVWSKTVTRSRVARVLGGGPGQPVLLAPGVLDLRLAPAGAKKLARSQPILLPKLRVGRRSRW